LCHSRSILPVRHEPEAVGGRAVPGRLGVGVHESIGGIVPASPEDEVLTARVLLLIEAPLADVASHVVDPEAADRTGTSDRKGSLSAHVACLYHPAGSSAVVAARGARPVANRGQRAALEGGEGHRLVPAHPTDGELSLVRRKAAELPRARSGTRRS